MSKDLGPFTVERADGWTECSCITDPCQHGDSRMRPYKAWTVWDNEANGGRGDHAFITRGNHFAVEYERHRDAVRAVLSYLEQNVLPEALPKPCNECPWRREAAAGWLGPHTAQEWCDIAHGEGPVACHKTIKVVNDEGVGEWSDPAIKQCAGLAIFRANICKSPRNPDIVVYPADREAVFSWDNEFIDHHDIRARLRKKAGLEP